LREIYFVRHGQASYGAEDYDRLSALGHQQSDWLGQHLAQTTDPFDRIVTGTLRRHRETFADVAKSLGQVQAHEDPRLNEMSYFVMESRYLAHAGRAAPQSQDGMAALFVEVISAWASGDINGDIEPFEDFRSRVLAAFDDHAQQGRRLLVISSGGPLGIIVQRALGLDIAAMANVMLATMNASFSRFLPREGRTMLLQFNAIPHLEARARHHAQTFL